MSLFTVNNVIINHSFVNKLTSKQVDEYTDNLTSNIKNMTTHKDLNVWKKSMNLVVLIYKLTGQFPKEELFGLSSQMRRSAVSIPSNIAEGHGRNSEKDLIRFLYISLGSASELETQLILSNKLNFLNDESFNKLNDANNEIIKMLVSLIRSKNIGQTEVQNTNSNDNSVNNK